MTGIMGANGPVQRLGPAAEIYTCPACGYTDGFHASFKIQGDGRTTEVYCICPECHRRFRPGWNITLHAGTRRSFILELKLELFLAALIFGMMLNMLFLLVIVLPSFAGIYEGMGSLPLVTRLLLDAGEWLRAHFFIGLPMMLAMLGLPASVLFIPRLSPRRYRWCRRYYFMGQIILLLAVSLMRYMTAAAVFVPMLRLTAM